MKLFALAIAILMTSQTVLGRTDSAFHYYMADDYERTFPADFYWKEDFYTQVYEANPSKTWMGQNNSFYSFTRDMEPLRIVAVYPALQTSTYWIDSIRATEAALDWYGIQYNIEFHSTRDMDSPVNEQRIIQTALESNDVDYLIYTIDSPYQADIIDNAIKSCVNQCHTKILINNSTSPLREWASNRQPLIYAGFDHFEGGKRLAAHLSEDLEDVSKTDIFHRIIVINRPHGLVNQGRASGFLDTLSEIAPNLKVSSYVTEPTVISRILNIANHIQERYPNNFIYSTSTAITAELVNAMNRPLAINGWGGTDIEWDLYFKGYINHIIHRYSDDVGIALATAIQWDLVGHKPPRIFKGRFHIFDEKAKVADIERIRSESSRFRNYVNY